MTNDPQTPHMPDAGAAPTIDQARALAPHPATLSHPLPDTDAMIYGTLKKHYGSQTSEQDVRFAQDLRYQLSAALGIAGAQTPEVAALTTRTRPSDAEIEQNRNFHLFELAKRAPAHGQQEANERPFAWPPLSAGAHHAVVELLKVGVTRTWGPSDLYDAIKANTGRRQSASPG
jgi:hypothetical protein